MPSLVCEHHNRTKISWLTCWKSVDYFTRITSNRYLKSTSLRSVTHQKEQFTGTRVIHLCTNYWIRRFGWKISWYSLNSARSYRTCISNWKSNTKDRGWNWVSSALHENDLCHNLWSFNTGTGKTIDLFRSQTTRQCIKIFLYSS